MYLITFIRSIESQDDCEWHCGSIYKEVVMACLKVMFQHLPVRPVGNHRGAVRLATLVLNLIVRSRSARDSALVFNPFKCATSILVIILDSSPCDASDLEIILT